MGNLVSNGASKARKKSLEAYCKPTGLYPSCPWEEKIVRRWIMNGKICPRYPDVSDYPDGGLEISSSTVPIHSDSEYNNAGILIGSGASGLDKRISAECPICMNSYFAMNKTACCSKSVCTECYLQVKLPSKNSICPFCNTNKFSVVYLGPVRSQEVLEHEIEEQCDIYARTRARSESGCTQNQNRNSRSRSEDNVARFTEDTTKRSTPVMCSTVHDRLRLESELRNRQRASSCTELHNFWTNQGHSPPNRLPYRNMCSGTFISDENIRNMVELLEGPEAVSRMMSGGTTLEQMEDMLVIAAMQMSLVDGHQQAENSLGPSNDEQRQQDSQRPTTASAEEHKGADEALGKQQPQLLLFHSFGRGCILEQFQSRM